MTADLHLLPLFRRDGEDQTEPLPGLFIATPPRKAARSRQNDQLILHLTFSGTATLNPQTQEQLLDRLTETYFQTSGAATSALRTLVESLNTALLKRNLRAEAKGLQAAGMLTAVILRQDQLLIGQSGLTHNFVVGDSQYQHYYDPQTSGHGLGLGRTTGLLINYISNQPGTLIILSPAPPSAWDTPALQTAYGRPVRTVQRGLLKPAGDDLNALLIEVREGTGKIYLHKSAPFETEPVLEKPGQEAPPPPSTSAYPKENIPTSKEAQPELETDTEPQPESRSEPAAQAPHRDTHIAPAITETQTQTHEPKPSTTPAAPRPRPARRPSPIGPALLTIGRASREALRSMGYTLRSLLSRLLPGEELFTIPSSTMAFIAIAVPILLVIIAFFIYQQRGRSSQFTTYLQYAQAAQINAQGKTTPEDLRTAWEAVIFYVDQAESYQVSDETQTLRVEAQAILDQLDSIQRVEFIPVLQTPLADNVNIHKMAATRENVYLLNQDGGNVVRVWQSGRGFETDLTFRCGPIPSEGLIVGPLIDFVPLPPVNYLDAQVLGMDANGILVYCLHDDTPIPVPLFPPDSNWGNPIAFTLDNDILYILDPQTNAVWVYFGDNYEFRERPSLFFDADVPPMADVIDLAVDRGELYLLHEDGHITTCSFAFGIQTTRCIDPAPYTDPRAENENAAYLDGTIFSQIVFTPPPDPSIYLLDPYNQSIYHLSLRLTLQRQFRPEIIDGPPRTPISSFALGPDRMLYIAFGNQVWVGSLP